MFLFLILHIFIANSIGIDSVREAFTAFFARYPYCYGYWKKLADLEKKNVQDGEEIALERCRETFDKGKVKRKV